MTLQNASQMPKVFYCRHMEPGIAKHPEGVYLTDRNCIVDMLPSFVGKPVYVYHVDDVDMKNLKEQAAGYVTEAFYNEVDGWAWAKFLVIDDKAHDAIKKGWSVSNAYKPVQVGPGGTKNNCPYKCEILQGEFTHLAIVPDPRYEGACIMTPEEFKVYQETHRKKLAELKNSKEKKPMLKFFKTEKKEVTAAEADMDTMIELQNGKSVTMQALVDNYLEVKKEPDFVLVEGKKVALQELINAMEKKNKKMKKNTDEETPDDSGDEDVEGDQDIEGDDEIGKDKKSKKNKKTKKNMSTEEDCMENESDEDEEMMDKKNKKAKTNSANSAEKEVEIDDKFFTELKNAHLNPKKIEKAPLVVTSIDQIERGKQRYGSGK